MTPDQRQRRIDEINRELAEIARNRSHPKEVAQREAALRKELDRLKHEAGVDHLLALPLMDEKVLRGSKRPDTGVPLMITIAMRSRLQALGYGDAEIDQMTPTEAWKILDGPGSV